MTGERGRASEHRGKALVFGEDTRSFLTIIRSLGRGGIEVHVAPSDLTSPSLRSRFIARVHRVPPYLGDGGRWRARLGELLREEGFDLVIACDERTLLPLDHHRADFTALTRLAIPSHEAISVLFDKARTREVAAAAGVAVADGRVLRADDTAAALVHEFGLPLVIKPSSSYTLDVLFERGRARVCADEADVAGALGAPGGGARLVERCHPGDGVGVSILAHEGRVLQAFQHARAHERGGASFYRVSAPLSPELEGAAQRIAAATRLTGVAMFEFKVEPRGGAWVLLEVNARPWGSMPLPVALGIDFPLWWYRLLVEGEEVAPRAYRIGVYQRNLLPDIQQIVAGSGDLAHRWRTLAPYFFRRAAECSRLLFGREHLDTLTRDDPAPGLQEIYRAAASALAHPAPIGAAARILRGMRDRAVVRRIMRRSGDGQSLIVVLCSGNVCRSPFAAELLRRSLFSGSNHIRIVSAGLLPREGEPCPKEAIEAARRAGVDLGAHRSAHLRAQDAREASLAVIFDRQNLYYLSARFPELVDRTVMLGSFLEPGVGAREIGDPDGSELRDFRRAYAVIAAAIPHLAAAIEGSC